MNLLQPYVQKNGKKYQSMRSDDPAVFEYYSFLEEPDARPINAVPDGCVDSIPATYHPRQGRRDKRDHLPIR